jgi:archaellum biogenesis ATPase FlaH
VTEWLVDGLIPKGHVVLLLGEAHSGKAWLAEQLAICVASGNSFLDRFEVQQQPVILVDEDSGTNSFKRRFYRLARGLDVDLSLVPLLCYSRCDFVLWDVHKRQWLRNLIKQQKGKPLVIIDSLERVMLGQDLYRTEAGAQVGQFWHELRDAGATLIMVHQISTKKRVSIEDWDITHLAPGCTMLVEGADMAICMFRAPTARTEFIMKPIERRARLKICRPFSVVLQEDESETWAKLRVSEELPELSGKAVTIP